MIALIGNKIYWNGQVALEMKRTEDEWHVVEVGTPRVYHMSFRSVLLVTDYERNEDYLIVFNESDFIMMEAREGDEVNAWVWFGWPHDVVRSRAYRWGDLVRIDGNHREVDHDDSQNLEGIPCGVDTTIPAPLQGA